MTAHAGIAQLVEHLSCKQKVVGSSPTAGSTWIARTGCPMFAITPMGVTYGVSCPLLSMGASASRSTPRAGEYPVRWGSPGHDVTAGRMSPWLELFTTHRENHAPGEVPVMRVVRI